MKKISVAVLLVFITFALPAQTAYYTGTGGWGESVAVLEAAGRGLSGDDDRLLLSII
jgi:hypothetical protein